MVLTYMIWLFPVNFSTIQFRDVAIIDEFVVTYSVQEFTKKQYASYVQNMHIET